MADAFTKYLGRNIIAWHMKHVGQELAEGRHPLMPEMQQSVDMKMPVLKHAEEEYSEEDPAETE